MSKPLFEPARYAAEEATRRWDELLAAAPATPDRQARVREARRQADRVLAGTGGARNPDYPALRADGTWHRVAALWLQVLTDTDAFTALANEPTPRCVAEPAAIRAWLTGPSTLPGFSHLTVAESWGWDTAFNLRHPDLHVPLDTLVAQAQRAGAFGVVGHTIRLWHLAGNDTIPDADLIALSMPGDLTVVSDPVPAAHLIERGSYGVDAAIGALIHTAHVVDGLLVGARRLPTSAASAPVRTVEAAPPAATIEPSRVARSFPDLDLAATTSPFGPAAIDTPKAAPRHPHR